MGEIYLVEGWYTSDVVCSLSSALGGGGCSPTASNIVVLALHVIACMTFSSVVCRVGVNGVPRMSKTFAGILKAAWVFLD